MFIRPRVSTGTAVASPARSSSHVPSPTPLTAADNKLLHNKLSLPSAYRKQNKTFTVTCGKVLLSERAAVQNGKIVTSIFFYFTVFCKVLFQNVLCSKQNKNIALISTNKLDEFTYISPYQEDNLKKHFRRKKLKFPRFSLSDNL